MVLKLINPRDLRKKAEDEETARIKAIKQALMDLTEKVLTKAGFNEFLEEKKSILLEEGKKIKKDIFIDPREFRVIGFEVEDICSQIKELLSDNEYCTDIKATDSQIKLMVWIDPKFFREEENEECK
jgi:hypothetical protein